ncbi:MAG: hypothetical protein ACSLFQ_07525 [Thermoanaerobaculia bacterium]
MRLVAPRTAFAALIRLLAAATMIAVIAVGAPMHSHDLAFGSGEAGAPQSSTCAACVSGASPGLVAESADFAPGLQPVDVVAAVESCAVALSLPIRAGRAPPAA